MSLHAIARHLDRLYPSQVDRTPCDWGHGHQAGHSGHEPRDGQWPSVGHFADAGNVGGPVFSIHPADVLLLSARLARLPDGSLDGLRIQEEQAFAGLRIRWHV